MADNIIRMKGGATVRWCDTGEDQPLASLGNGYIYPDPEDGPMVTREMVREVFEAISRAGLIIQWAPGSAVGDYQLHAGNQLWDCIAAKLGELSDERKRQEDESEDQYREETHP